ncbi:hypothetical protein ACLOJK_019513 [Asimina triloba]
MGHIVTRVRRPLQQETHATPFKGTTWSGQARTLADPSGSGPPLDLPAKVGSRLASSRGTPINVEAVNISQGQMGRQREIRGDFFLFLRSSNSAPQFSERPEERDYFSVLRKVFRAILSSEVEEERLILHQQGETGLPPFSFPQQTPNDTTVGVPDLPSTSPLKAVTHGKPDQAPLLEGSENLGTLNTRLYGLISPPITITVIGTTYRPNLPPRREGLDAYRHHIVPTTVPTALKHD